MPVSRNESYPVYIWAASDTVQKKGITHILSCAKELPPCAAYMYLNLQNRNWENIERYFDISRLFIEALR